MPYVLKKFPKVKLVITGAFTDVTSQWQNLAKKLKVEGNVIWLGEVDDKYMGELYENAAVYVYTAPNEDYGM